VELAHSTCSWPVPGTVDENSYGCTRYRGTCIFFSVFCLILCYCGPRPVFFIPLAYSNCLLPVSGASDVSAEDEEEFCYCRNMGILVTLEPLHKVLWGWSCYADQRVSKSRTKVSNLHSHCLEKLNSHLSTACPLYFTSTVIFASIVTLYTVTEVNRVNTW
jgi:hypothetical protein